MELTSLVQFTDYIKSFDAGSSEMPSFLVTSFVQAEASSCVRDIFTHLGCLRCQSSVVNYWNHIEHTGVLVQQTCSDTAP